MPCLFSDTIDVSYCTLQLFPEGDSVGNSVFRTQRNGLCGFGERNCLNMIVGLHTGNVGFEAHLFDHDPGLDGSWEEVVEFPFHVSEPDLQLQGLLGSKWHLIQVEAGSYHGRYCARNMDAGRERDTNSGDPVDFYRLELWPGTLHQDRIVKATSEIAKHWHKAYGQS